MLSGLVFLEKQCVVHRDLKLSNLLLTVDGKVIICDFGKAMLIDKTFSLEYKFGGELAECNCHVTCNGLCWS